MKTNCTIMKTFDYELRDKVRAEISEEQIKFTKNYYEQQIANTHKDIVHFANPYDLCYAWRSLFQLNLALAYYVDDEYGNMIINTNLPFCAEKYEFYNKLIETINCAEPGDLYKTPTNEPDEDPDLCDLTKPLLTDSNTTSIADPFDGHTPYFDMTSTADVDCGYYHGHKLHPGTQKIDDTIIHCDPISTKWLSDTNAADLLNDKFQTVKDKIAKVEITTKDPNVNDNDLECDYTQPDVRKVCDEDKYKKDLNDLPYFKCATKGGKIENDLVFNKELYDKWNSSLNQKTDGSKYFEPLKKSPDIKLNTEGDKKNLEKYEMVQHPHHYNSYDVEVIEMMRRIWGDEAVMTWCLLTAWKYRQRMGTKPDNPINQDLKKEEWYLDKYYELKKNLNK